MKSMSSANRFQDLMMAFSGSYDGLVLCDANGVLININESYRRITEVSDQDVQAAMGRPMHHLVADGIVTPSVTVEVLRQKKPVTLVQWIKTGKQVLVTGNPIFDEMGCIKAVVTNVRNPDILRLTQQPAEAPDCGHDPYTHSPRLIAESPEMIRVLDVSRQIASSELPVLLLGESGTGKDLVARFIHGHGRRSGGPFIPVNCAAINEQLFEAELFGYQGGAFTGASRRGKQGLVKLAHGGTLFLDEVAEMPMAAQAKLLRFLQDMAYYPVGATSLHQVDVRVICATNQDLADIVAKGRFREDLYYRIAGMPIFIPPLRERKEDVSPLARHFLTTAANRDPSSKTLSRSARKALETFAWPGNVRQLQNTMQRLHAIVQHDEITSDDICRWIDGSGLTQPAADPANSSYQQVKTRWDRDTLKHALETQGGIRAAARALKVAPSTVLRKKRKYGL
ncbi:MAG: sigma-54 interaction domain-containing protein [Desulfosalsimonas sp.]